MNNSPIASLSKHFENLTDPRAENLAVIRHLERRFSKSPLTEKLECAVETVNLFLVIKHNL